MVSFSFASLSRTATALASTGARRVFAVRVDTTCQPAKPNGAHDIGGV